MGSESRAGRPHASSRETLSEAACELFLEQGYDATSIVDITRRAGVSRSSFFNYFTSKSDVLWGTFDERLASVGVELTAQTVPTDDSVRAAIIDAFSEYVPDALVLAIRDTDAMGLTQELRRDSASRHSRIAEVVAYSAFRGGVQRPRADLIGAVTAGASLGAFRHWAQNFLPASDLPRVLQASLEIAAELRWTTDDASHW